MKKLLREPLLHFLLLGALIFGAYRLKSKPESNGTQQILVTQSRIESLSTTFERTWQRSPSGPELDGLIRDYIREEACAREAVLLGLDKDDTIIRRRLRQKLEFISQDLATFAEPTDEQLQDYLTRHSEDFRTQRHYTFCQVYLDPQKHAPDLAANTAKLLLQLRATGPSADVDELGDSLMLEHRFREVSSSEVAKQFGAGFAANLGEMPVGKWQGPIESGYGSHLVFIVDRTEGHVAALQEAREAVRLEWLNAKRVEANEKFYKTTLQRYTVVIEPRQADPKELAAARR